MAGEEEYIPGCIIRLFIRKYHFIFYNLMIISVFVNNFCFAKVINKILDSIDLI